MRKGEEKRLQAVREAKEAGTQQRLQDFVGRIICGKWCIFRQDSLNWVVCPETGDIDNYAGRMYFPTVRDAVLRLMDERISDVCRGNLTAIARAIRDARDDVVVALANSEVRDA